MIEVYVCLSSELFQAAVLSEHAPDKVSQGGERAVITGRLEGRSITQTVLRGVRHAHTGPVCMWVVLVVATQYSSADRQPSFRGLYLSSSILFPVLSFSLVFSFLQESMRRERAPLTGLLKYLCWQGKDKNVISNKTCFHINTCSDSAMHMKHLLPKTPPPSLGAS